VVGILRRAGQKDASPMRSWSTDASDVRNDPVIAAELSDWLRSQGIKDTVSHDRIIVCPHEEGGQSCSRRPRTGLASAGGGFNGCPDTPNNVLHRGQYPMG
jgi:hypothetical protein